MSEFSCRAWVCQVQVSRFESVYRDCLLLATDINSEGFGTCLDHLERTLVGTLQGCVDSVTTYEHNFVF